MNIVSKYSVTSPSLLHIEDILKKYVDDYKEKFEFYTNLCNWKLDFDNITICVKSERN